MITALDYPALEGRTVTQGHADYCQAHGHATHNQDGVAQPHCPRCGDLLSVWAVTKLAHPAVRDYRDDCPECLALVDQAISHAQATGSKGATYGVGAAEQADNHSATVARALQVVFR